MFIDTMKKILGAIVLVAALMAAAPGFAGKGGCCPMKNAAQESSMRCMHLNLADLNLNADQKQNIEKWREECCNAGCTNKSHAQFLKKAKAILSPEQYNKLKAEGGAGKKAEA